MKSSRMIFENSLQPRVYSLITVFSQTFGEKRQCSLALSLNDTILSFSLNVYSGVHGKQHVKCILLCVGS